MSVQSVTDRIAQIEAQIQQFQAVQPGDTATAQAFATELSRASTLTAASDVASRLAGDGSATPTTSQQAVVAEARKYVGLPYVWGGTSISTGVDCSGLVQSVYQTMGYDLPRVSADQARAGRAVGSMAEAEPGDLLAWNNSSRNAGADHIAIYIGDGKMIEAPRTGLDVRIVDVPSTPDYIRRILPDSAETSARALTPASLDGGAGRVALAQLTTARAAFDQALVRQEAS